MKLSLSKKGEEIAKNIRSTFEKNISSLKIQKQRHFLIRLYRITKDESYKKLVAKLFLKKEEQILNDINKFNDKNYVIERAEELFNKLLVRKEEKYLQRQKTFRNKKRHLFYYKIIEHLRLLNMLGLSGKTYFKKGVRLLKNSRHERYILDEGIIKYYGTQIINYVYYLKYLKITDLRKKFKAEFEKIFMKQKPSNELMYNNKIYGLTHFIITGSDYYQRYVSLKEFGWVINYFKKHIKEILQKTDEDIVSEVGLCFKLCKIKSGKEINLITKYLLQKYNKKLGYIPRKEGGLNESEHTNIIAYLFLCNFKKLYKGPNIRKELD